MSDERIESLLPQEMLEGFRERAAGYDSENTFFFEDFVELQRSGYLAATVPTTLGGAGLSLEELVRAQRRLASYAPATALGVNMHLVWVQVARFLHDRVTVSGGLDAGESGCSGPLDWVLRDAVAGETFAFGISEAGNEAVLMDSNSVAKPRETGGFSVSGTKIFTTLSPVWTRLGVHARIENEEALVFGFVRRDGAKNENLLSGSVAHPGTWNPLGMRATQSYNTVLADVTIAPDDVAATMPPFDGSNPIVLGIFSSFSILTAAVYAGIADRALELATEAANKSVPLADGGEGSRLDDPDIAARITTAVLAHRASTDSLDILARDIDEKRNRADWFLALGAARNLVTDEAREAVAVAMRLVGSRGFQADGELARLYRDVLGGLFHPTSSKALARTVRDSLRSS